MVIYERIADDHSYIKAQRHRNYERHEKTGEARKT